LIIHHERNKTILQSIQNNEDRFDNEIPYEINKDEGTISFNFGDLLSQVPIAERLKWKQFYREIRTDVIITIPIHEAYKLLFFDIESTWERKAVKDYWKKLIENLEGTIEHMQQRHNNNTRYQITFSIDRYR
jgi:hypothetical protein